MEQLPPLRWVAGGRRLHYVRNAVYSETPGQRSNRREAEEVVSLIAAHVRDFPDESLGVVTMNIPQMELIEDLLLNVPPPIQSFCADDAKFLWTASSSASPMGRIPPDTSALPSWGRSSRRAVNDG
jgi:hypothetical protein